MAAAGQVHHPVIETFEKGFQHERGFRQIRDINPLAGVWRLVARLPANPGAKISDGNVSRRTGVIVD
jgi:hypothetical protein